MTSREAALAALALAGMAACAGGLLVDAGNAYPCDFSQDVSVRDQACPSGWICGVTDLCQALVDEGLPDGAVRPTLGPGELFAPQVLDASVQALTRNPVTGRVRLQLADGRTAETVGPTAMEVASTGDFSEGVFLPDYSAVLLDGGVVQVIAPGPTQTVSIPGVAQVAHLRSFPGPPTPPLQLIYTKPLLTGFFTGFYNVLGGTFQDLTLTVSQQLLDARVMPTDLLGLGATSAQYSSVAVIVDGADLLRRPQLYFWNWNAPATAGTWVDLEDLTAPAMSLPATGQGRLRHSPNGEVWAAVLRDTSLSSDVLATWQLSFSGSGLEANRLWKDCTPCNGKVRAFQPTLSGSPAVEIVCEAPDGVSRTAVQVLGSNARDDTDSCTTVPLAAPFDLLELSSVDDALGGQITLGGVAGELWTGDAVSTTVPLFLDRIPDAIGAVRLNLPDGGTGGFSLPFASTFFAIGGPNSQFPAYASSRDGVPRAPIEGVPNWLVTDDARIIKLQAAGILTTPLAPYQVQYGPRLIDPLGNPAAAPYGGDAVGDAGLFVVSGSDSLYTYQVSSLRSTPFVDSSTDLSPQLTPQAGSPIRSVAVEPLAADEDLDAGIHGYVISGNLLYRFSKDGAPVHWESSRIDLSASEPVEVWSVGDGRKLGRVAFRDGSIFTLPSGLPLVAPLPTDQTGPDRVFDFEDLNGFPVCFSPRGLFLAQQVPGQRVLTWGRVNVPSDVAAAQNRPQGGRLSRGPDGSLMLFLDQGRVYTFTVSSP